ncbi:hypothetical protein A2U01_0034414 [Trifolium medium]|uniref:Uncharacterized protein n=1 Tax=Trifolium medium TaxID=97028 RepID=A0A392PNT2_9FABA|nr:hypothetical protein [Trifolium medium]
MVLNLLRWIQWMGAIGWGAPLREGVLLPEKVRTSTLYSGLASVFHFVFLFGLAIWFLFRFCPPVLVVCGGYATALEVFESTVAFGGDLVTAKRLIPTFFATIPAGVMLTSALRR